MLTKIKFGVMEHRKVAANGIEPDGLARIAELLEGAGIPPELMEHVEPVWATKRGTFPKRLAKVLKKSGYTTTPALMGAIGQVAADNSSRTDEYWFRIDREFTCEERGFRYDRGEHGDGESCYHPGGMYDHAPYDIEGSGGMLLRTFEPSTHEYGYHFDYEPGEPGRYYSGVARCFIVPCTYHDSEDEFHEGYVLINGYCQHGYNQDLLHLARLVATAEGLAYRKVAVRDHFCRIYVNNNSGYLIGEWENIGGVRSVDIYVKDSGRTPSLVMRHCNSCGDRCEEEDLTAVGEDLICPECLRIDYIPCRRCGEWALKWDSPTVAGEQWCRTCAEEHSVVCGCCGERHPEVEVYKVGREYWCEPCFNQYAVECAVCGTHYAPGDIYETGDRALCWDCAHNRCAQCGESVDRPLKIDDRPYCRRCAPI